MVSNRIGTEWSVLETLPVLECGDTRIKCGDIILPVWPDESPPPDQGVCEFVGSFQADIPGGLHLGNKGSNKPGVLFNQDFVSKSLEDIAFGIVGLDLIKVGYYSRCCGRRNRSWQRRAEKCF
ncbi:MAG: hypothetical protein ACQXXC_05165 [Methanolinea tarda]